MARKADRSWRRVPSRALRVGPRRRSEHPPAGHGHATPVVVAPLRTDAHDGTAGMPNFWSAVLLAMWHPSEETGRAHPQPGPLLVAGHTWWPFRGGWAPEGTLCVRTFFGRMPGRARPSCLPREEVSASDANDRSHSSSTTNRERSPTDPHPIHGLLGAQPDPAVADYPHCNVRAVR